MMFSSNVLKRWSFLQKSHWNMTFLVISGKIVFLLSRKYDIFSLDGKLKNIFLKNTWKYDMFYIYV